VAWGSSTEGVGRMDLASGHGLSEGSDLHENHERCKGPEAETSCRAHLSTVERKEERGGGGIIPMGCERTGCRRHAGSPGMDDGGGSGCEIGTRRERRKMVHSAGALCMKVDARGGTWEWRICPARRTYMRTLQQIRRQESNKSRLLSGGVGMGVWEAMAKVGGHGSTLLRKAIWVLWAEALTASGGIR